MKKIFVTGSAGFIGAELTKKLLDQGDMIVGIDNHNSYYDPKLKQARLNQFSEHKNYTHYKNDIKNFEVVKKIFDEHKFDAVVNLAAQAGVQYSLINPNAYIESNIIGFHNILECVKENKTQHLIYASSSSVYGSNKTMPFRVEDMTDHPISLYAASKKSNELMANAYSHLYNLRVTGLRFFSVYGPWGRPDMALWKFTEQIFNNQKIQLYNNGEHLRDFTYIDDIVDGLLSIVNSKFTQSKNKNKLASVYNIGNGNPVKLEDFVNEIEKSLGLKAKKDFLPLQKGDVPATWADISLFSKDYGYKPKTSIYKGVDNFVRWYNSFIKNSR